MEGLESFQSKIYIFEPWMLPFCNSFTSIADQSSQKQLNNSVEAINGDFWLVTSTESKFKVESRAVLISSVTIDAVGKKFYKVLISSYPLWRNIKLS